MKKNEILDWLHEADGRRLEALYRRADEVRRRNVGDEVHLRGLIEISNHCVRNCGYCGLRSGHKALARYRMTIAEIMECVRQAGVPITNYGITIAWSLGIFERALAPFPGALETYHQLRREALDSTGAR